MRYKKVAIHEKKRQNSERDDPLNGNCNGFSHTPEGRRYNDAPLLPAGTRTLSSELLGFHPTGIRNQQRPVVCNQLLSQLKSTRSVDVFHVVCDDGLSNSLTDGVYSRDMSTTVHTNSNIDTCELLLANDKNCFVDLKPQDLRLQDGDRRAVYFNETLPFACVGDGRGGLAR